MYAIVMLADSKTMMAMFGAKDQVAVMRHGVSTGAYTMAACGPIKCDKAGEEAAEEMFELTNDPSRQEEREDNYGRGRSVSVGDIVIVDGEMYGCCSMGWKKV